MTNKFKARAPLFLDPESVERGAKKGSWRILPHWKETECLIFFQSTGYVAAVETDS